MKIGTRKCVTEKRTLIGSKKKTIQEEGATTGIEHQKYETNDLTTGRTIKENSAMHQQEKEQRKGGT